MLSCRELMPQTKLGPQGSSVRVTRRPWDAFGSVGPPKAGLGRHRDGEAPALLAFVRWGHVLSSRPWALQGWGPTQPSSPLSAFSAESPFCIC